MRKKRQLDDPRALRDAVSGAVIFVLSTGGAAARSLPGPAVIKLLESLGFEEPAARATILRMRRAGWLTSARRGPIAEYALSAPARELADSVVAPLLGQRPPWSGSFGGLLFSVPEADRAYRDALRRAAVLAGFGLLRAGLLITADERRWERVRGLIEAAPASSRVIRVELLMSLQDAQAAASEAWPLETLASTYRAQARAMLQLAERHRAAPPTGAAAVRVMWEAMAPISAAAIDDPCLPAALLPADWPGEAIETAIDAVGAIAGPPLLGYLTELRAAYPG